MSNIISRYKAILPVSLFALSAQGVMAQDAPEADTINVAFRKADARDVITPVSTVNVKNLLEKNYNTYSLDNMQALAAGYNGSLWNQGDALVLIDGVPRDANNVLPLKSRTHAYLLARAKLHRYHRFQAPCSLRSRACPDQSYYLLGILEYERNNCIYSFRICMFVI